MSVAARFHVEDVGDPVLASEGEAAPPPEVDQLQAEAVAPGWSPEDAAKLVAGVCTAAAWIAFCARKGRMFSAPEAAQLAGRPQEFPASGQALVPLLDRFLPLDAGGGLVAAGVGLLGIPVEIGMAVSRRLPLLKEDEREPGLPASAPPGEPPPPAPETPADSGSYRMPGELLSVVRPQRDDSLGGIGL